MAALTPQAFAKRWSESTLSERASYQQHFLDLCEVLGAPKPAETDPTGEFYAFEKGVEKTGGGKGFADVWHKGRFAVEYKGRHKDLGAAYQQLLQYRESLENPPLLVVTDTDRFEVHTNFTGTVTQVYSFTNAELPEPENLRVLRAMFFDPYCGQKAVNSLRRAERSLAAFAERLRGVRVLDPACGSGNFLYVSLKELLDLEKEVSAFAGEIGLTSFFPGVNPEQLHGIETSPYAHELAQVAIWIGYLQWMTDNGFGSPSEPILGPMTNIVEMDAILGHDEDGNPIEPDWPEADVIVGNPPFLGGSKIRAELSDEYVSMLWNLYEGHVPGGADLVCYWFERARNQLRDGKTERVGLLATNSIRGGSNRRVLERIKQTGDIFFAESDRPWILNGAAVRVSMVGFDAGSVPTRILDGVPVEAIYADLTGAIDLLAARPLGENRGTCFYSIKKGGPFEISGEVARHWLSLPTNPNGRPNKDVVRPWYNGLDVARRPRDMWIVDYGVETTEQEAALYEAPFEYVRSHVKPIRDKNRRERRRRLWWLFSETAPGMRRGTRDLSRFIVTPAVSTHHLLVWVDPSILPDQQLIVFAREDDYFFGVLHSRVHELWALRMGTWMGVGNDPRYTPTTCFETFPFPEPSEEDRASISEAARRLDGLRRNWLNPEGASEAELKKRTLTNLYNARPTWLDNAHKSLDGAVFGAYGWSADISEEDTLKNLLALNLERSGADAAT